MAYKKSKFWTNFQLAITAAAIGFLASTVLFYEQVDRLAKSQERLELMVGAVAPLRQMQAMAARFERAKWEPLAASMLVAKVYQRAKELHLDPLLVEAVIIVESARDTNAVSHKGAKGLMQLMPVHLEPGEDPHEPILNIEKGTAYLAQCLRKSRGIYRYNAGLHSDPRKNLPESVKFEADVARELARLRSL